jgi:hypothetical protein
MTNISLHEIMRLMNKLLDHKHYKAIQIYKEPYKVIQIYKFLK